MSRDLWTVLPFHRYRQHLERRELDKSSAVVRLAVHASKEGSEGRVADAPRRLQQNPRCHRDDGLGVILARTVQLPQHQLVRMSLLSVFDHHQQNLVGAGTDALVRHGQHRRHGSFGLLGLPAKALADHPSKRVHHLFPDLNVLGTQFGGDGAHRVPVVGTAHCSEGRADSLAHVGVGVVERLGETLRPHRKALPKRVRIGVELSDEHASLDVEHSDALVERTRRPQTRLLPPSESIGREALHFLFPLCF
mmetsp:Transcript_50040/g.113912  ORF Transcript_50040/g.113912 Transcript_50040/m.113912 type:complete len:250 (-) Transcript_50040:57-806(-)